MADTFRKGQRVELRHVSRASTIGGPNTETEQPMELATIEKKTTYGGRIGYNVKVDGKPGILNVPAHELTLMTHPFWG